MTYLELRNAIDGLSSQQQNQQIRICVCDSLIEIETDNIVIDFDPKDPSSDVRIINEGIVSG